MCSVFFFFKQKTAYEIMPSLVGSEMCIRDSSVFSFAAELDADFLTYSGKKAMGNLSQNSDAVSGFSLRVLSGAVF